jgi:hypothetical protein
MSIPRVLVIALCLAVAGCGGGSSSPTSPTPAAAATPAPVATATPTPAPQPPANFGVFSFSFDAGTSVSDQALIGEAVQIASDYFTTTFGRTLTQPVQIRGSLTAQGCGLNGTGGAAAFTGQAVSTYCMGNQGWNANGPILKRKIVIHETYHLLQFERRWLGLPGGQASGPTWLIEGSAELVGYHALDSRGLLPYSTSQGCQVKEFTDFGVNEPPGLPNLDAVESPEAFSRTRGPLYALSMTGLDQLIGGRGLAALNTYMDSLANAANPWPTAFQSAFGQTPAAFYAQFPSYRASLPVPASYQCRF